MPDTYSNPRYPILLREIDLLHDTIKNLDDIIYKTKNFAILWKILFYKDAKWYYLLMIVISLLFGLMHG
jgi:hypothetical protein